MTVNTAREAVAKAKPAPSHPACGELGQGQVHKGLSLHNKVSEPQLCQPASHSCTRIPPAPASTAAGCCST